MMNLSAYIPPLRRWWWLILAAALVAATASFLTLRREPDIYQSEATLLVGGAIEDPNPSGNQFSAGEQLAATYADLARTEPVRRAVMESLGLSALPQYEVSTLPRTQLIKIAVRDTNPERAQAVANTLAGQLVQLSPSGVDPEERERQAFLNEQLDKLQTQIEETEAEIEAKQIELGELFSARQINETQRELTALEAKLNSLQNNFASMMAGTREGAVNSITIIEPASLPRTPVDPRHEITMLVAVGISVVLAGGAAYFMEYLDDTLREPEDVKRFADNGTTVTIAGIDLDEDGSRLITHTQPRSPHAEAFRILRTAIQYARKEERQRLLLVTSPRTGDGKSLIAANLAVVLAQSGLRVLLVDADLRRSVQHEIFDMNNEVGLADLLSGESDLLLEEPTPIEMELERPTSVENLWLLTSGTMPENPSELLGSSSMRLVLTELERRFDYVVVDSPPCLAVTDPVVLSTQVDAVFVVVKAEVTRRRELEETIARLNAVSSKVRGIILNHSTKVKDQYYYVDSYYRRDEGKDSKTSRLTAYFNGNKDAVPEQGQGQTDDIE